MAADDASNLILLLLFLAAAFLAWRYWSNRETPDEKARRLEEEARQRRAFETRRSGLLNGPIPPDVLQDMRTYLRDGKFAGAEHSPLAYVGDKAGKSGLAEWDRHRRVKICLAIEIPDVLGPKYKAWGPPVTARRYAAIRDHLIMLANYRRNRPNYRYAVADWEADAVWFRAELSDFADQLQHYGFRG